jgi:hypothetical protein
MNHLVPLDARAGELEKILSGVKTMLIQEFDPTQTPAHPVNPGDTLYFLREPDDRAVRVKSTVIRVQSVRGTLERDPLSRILKEMQPRLQLTEDQYNFWSEKQQILLVEFESAQKIPVIRVAPCSAEGWMAFEALSQIM